MFAQAHTRSETTATRHSVSSPLTPITGGRGIQSSLFLNNFLGYLRGHLAWASWDPEALAKRPLTPCPTEEPPPHNHPPASTTTPSRAKHHHHPSVTSPSVSFYTFFVCVSRRFQAAGTPSSPPRTARPFLPRLPSRSPTAPSRGIPSDTLHAGLGSPEQGRTGQGRAGCGRSRPLPLCRRCAAASGPGPAPLRAAAPGRDRAWLRASDTLLGPGLPRPAAFRGLRGVFF